MTTASTIEVIEPATEEVMAELPRAGVDELDSAVARAKAAFPAWRAVDPAERSSILRGLADAIEERAGDLATMEARNAGKPISDAEGEIGMVVECFRYYAGAPERLLGQTIPVAGGVDFTFREPLGVVGLITPWNFPAAIPVWKLAPALVHGNTVVLKLAQEAPLTGLHLARCFHEAGIPAGVLNVVVGRGSEVGTPLVRHPLVRAISFTGSVAVGREVRDAATALGKRVQLELGGHNPLIVMADADLDRAAEAAYAGAFWSAGQKCTATRRIYVEEAVYDDFRGRLLARMERGRVGDPADPETEVGPIVNEQQLNGIVAAVEQGRREGGTVLAGGERLDEEAYLYAPTLFEGVGDEAMLSCEEVFGPVTSLYRFATLDEALRRANAVPFGLAAAIFTSSLASAQRFVGEAQAGLLHVNSQTAGADVHVPFGGIKDSGFGPHEQGRAAMEFFTESVTVYQDA